MDLQEYAAVSGQPRSSIFNPFSDPLISRDAVRTAHATTGIDFAARTPIDAAIASQKNPY